MTHIETDKWYLFDGLRPHLDKLSNTDKLTLIADHYNTIVGRLATERGESKKMVDETFELGKIPQKELEKEIEKTLAEWKKIFEEEYNKWKAEGVEVEREHKDETFFTFPYPHPPGFAPSKMKEKRQHRTNILTGVKRKFEKREKRMKKELPKRG